MFTKIGLPLLVLVLGAIGGIGLQQKVLAPHQEKIDYARIENIIKSATPPPAPAVSVQPFDVNKIKNLKSFTYSPDFTGSVSIAGVDSAAMKKYIEDAVMKAFQKHVSGIESTKRKRR